MKDPDHITGTNRPYADEQYITVTSEDFVETCNRLHKELNSAVMMLFAEDLRQSSGTLELYCVFLDARKRSWVTVKQSIPQDAPAFNSLSKDIYSASLFERETKEMFGLEPKGNPDVRGLKLHGEVWQDKYYPLRKDFIPPKGEMIGLLPYKFKRVEGEGIFEVPVGPVHAGIIGPGHFRFSVAGEPIINLELRLGWKHRGIEKLLEEKTVFEAVKICECISGDTAFGYSLAFCHAVEKIFKTAVPVRAQVLRVLFAELERIYNHANDIGGMALDVGFSFPSQFASLIKETVLGLNESVCGSRYLKGINVPGGVTKDIDEPGQKRIRKTLDGVLDDFAELEKMLFASISFMDRVDSTGVLRIETARDLGVTGVAARASGIGLDMRKVFGGIYDNFSFQTVKEHTGDVAARLKVRFGEVKESMSIIDQCLKRLEAENSGIKIEPVISEGFGMGCVEAWRGALCMWVRINAQGKIERCKIVDPSFLNWEALSFAVLGNIIPDFPLCNKSFDLSYSGNDL